MSKSTRNILAFFLIIVVFTRPVGFLLQNSELMAFGKNTIVSPLPVPFGTFFGYENLSSKVEIILTYENSLVETLDIKNVISELPPVHRAHITQLWSFWMLPILSKTTAMPVLDYLLCETQTTFLDKKVVSATIIHRSLITNEVVAIKEHRCRQL